MKKLLCYLGIIILLGLISFPPILRMTLPEKKEEIKQEEIVYINLMCSNDEYMTSTSYTNDKVNMIILKKINNYSNSENKDNEEELNNIVKSTGEDFVQMFEILKDKSTVVHNVSEDGEVLTIDFSLSDNKGLNIDNLTKKVVDQKLYYENQNLTCIEKNL